MRNRWPRRPAHGAVDGDTSVSTRRDVRASCRCFSRVVMSETHLFRHRTHQAGIGGLCGRKRGKAPVDPPLGAVLEVAARTLHIVLGPFDLAATLDDADVEGRIGVDHGDAACGRVLRCHSCGAACMKLGGGVLRVREDARDEQRKRAVHRNNARVPELQEACFDLEKGQTGRQAAKGRG